MFCFSSGSLNVFIRVVVHWLSRSSTSSSNSSRVWLGIDVPDLGSKRQLAQYGVCSRVSLVRLQQALRLLRLISFSSRCSLGRRLISLSCFNAPTLGSFNNDAFFVSSWALSLAFSCRIR